MNRYGQKVRKNAYIYNPPRKLSVRQYVGSKDHSTLRGYGATLIPGLYKSQETYKNLLDFVKGNKKVNTTTHSKYQKTFGSKFDNFHHHKEKSNSNKFQNFQTNPDVELQNFGSKSLDHKEREHSERTENILSELQ